MELIFDNWMWFGFGAGVTILIILFFSDIARFDKTKNRWHDPMWLAWFGVAAYMIHNVEEYGIDLTGTHLHFVTLMRGMFGENVSDWAFLGCNLPLIWVVSPLIAYVCWKKNLKGMATAMALFGLMNGVSHVGQGFNIGYNPGLLTGAVLFIPFALWVTYIVYMKKHLPWKHFMLTFLTAFLYHAILILGCQLAVREILLGMPQGIYMTLDAILFGGLIYAVNKSSLGNWKE